MGLFPQKICHVRQKRLRVHGYQVLSLDLPAEMSPQELVEVEESRKRALINQQNLQIKKKVQEASHIGDTDTALEELERLIAQKRRME